MLGLRPVLEDEGRRAVTGLQADRGAFKTPSLHNTALHRSWFHNGSADSLTDVIEVYDLGGGAFPDNLDPAIFPLGLTTAEKQELVAFLHALTDPRVAAELYPFDRPLLGAETGAFGEVIGSATGTPRAVLAHAPGLGNPRFGLMVRNVDPSAITLWAADTQRAAPGGFNIGGITLHLGCIARFGGRQPAIRDREPCGTERWVRLGKRAYSRRPNAGRTAALRAVAEPCSEWCGERFGRHRLPRVLIESASRVSRRARALHAS